MAELILPNNGSGGEKDPNSEQQKDLAEFATEITAACRAHSKLPPSMMIGALSMIAMDLHHNVINNIQQTQLAQEALAKVAAQRIKNN